MAGRVPYRSRDAYRVFRAISTRWMDNDAFGHVNNTVYYSWFDTAVNAYLVETGVLDLATSTTICLVVETGCRYARSITFPEGVEAGIRVVHLGTSSVRYEVGLFVAGSTTAAAEGVFVHVHVDRVTRRPLPFTAAWRTALERVEV